MLYLCSKIQQDNLSFFLNSKSNILFLLAQWTWNCGRSYWSATFGA